MGELPDDRYSITAAATPQALVNPLILTGILGNLDISGISAARLVCRSWSDIGAAVLGRNNKLCLNLTKMLPCCVVSSVSPLFNIKLAKHIKLYERCSCEKDTAYENVAYYINFHLLLPYVDHILQEMDLHDMLDKHFGSLLIALQNYDFPNLHTFCIQVSSSQESENCVAGIESLTFRARPALKSIVAYFDKLCCDKQAGMLTIYHKIMQALFNSAPNLEAVDIGSNFYPDLRFCSKLKVLKFHFYGSNMRDLVMTDVTQMLSLVRESVQDLTLKYYSYRNGAPEDEVANLVLPIMPKLESLKIDQVDTYRVHSGSIRPIRLPKLNHLYLCTKWMRNIHHIYENLWIRHAGVTSLHILSEYDPSMETCDLGDRIVGLFPSMKKIYYQLMFRENKALFHFKRMVEAFEKWEQLEESTFAIEYAQNSEIIATLLGVLVKLKGLKTVRILLGPSEYGVPTPESEFLDHLKSAFLACKPFKMVHISGYFPVYTGEMDAEMDGFIQTHQLPISFNERLFI